MARARPSTWLLAASASRLAPAEALDAAPQQSNARAWLSPASRHRALPLRSAAQSAPHSARAAALERARVFAIARVVARSKA
jgi:hypothetical protein